MKIKEIYSFFLLSAIISGIALLAPSAFAGNTEITITPTLGSNLPTDDCIDVKYGCYTPSTATVDVGGKVIFLNTDSNSHTFTAGTPSDRLVGEFDSGLLKTNDSFEYIADTAGEFEYFCMLHPWTQGLLIVEKALIVESLKEESVKESIVVDPLKEESVKESLVEESIKEESIVEVPSVVDENQGGCLIATATFGSELAPQVQYLREIRDNTLLSTASGVSFMESFNQVYYSFSPYIADMERQNPLFKESVKLFLTPMLSTLSIMTLAEESSESSVLGLGISVIALNLAIYVAAPAIVPALVMRRLRQ